MRRTNLVLILALVGPLAPAILPAQTTQRGAQLSVGSQQDAPGGLEYFDEPEPAGKPLSHAAQELLQGDFDRLELTALHDRTKKTRTPNGAWALSEFYANLKPRTPGDSQYLQQIQAWIKAKPDSMVPYIALAGYYNAWAWSARGTRPSDHISDEQWGLYDERFKQAHQVLDAAANLKPMDPEWFRQMQDVAIAEQWTPDKMKALFDQAVAVEPEYGTPYRDYCNYLQPKWFGKPGEPVAFARESADKLGGDRGDILYFQLATLLVNKSNAGSTQGMDWQRIQRGHTALESEYGGGRSELNYFAYMAYRFRDRATATRAFATIGNDWNSNIWRSHQEFGHARTWALGNDN